MILKGIYTLVIVNLVIVLYYQQLPNARYQVSF